MKSRAWYDATREEFLVASRETIAAQLAVRAADESLEIEADQALEWRRSVELLQATLRDGLPILQRALSTPGAELVRHVILEFDFKRRGLRMDCLLLADGVLFVLEFKRTEIGSSDRDQVMGYAVNLIEFHKITQQWCKQDDALVVPIVVLTEADLAEAPEWPGVSGGNWPSLAARPLEADAITLGSAIASSLSRRKSSVCKDRCEWLDSDFSPSSSIIDATLSLYGNHDVAAIAEHAAPAEAIKRSVDEINEQIAAVFAEGGYHIIFLSGAPGAGKTLVGLDVAMRGNHAATSVLVTGNVPLVNVLNRALKGSYQTQATNTEVWTRTGYRRKDAAHVINAANFKIVKAHAFLGALDQPHGQTDGRVLVFDEAQRTYEKGRIVNRRPLRDHEANLVLQVQRDAYPAGGAVVLALIGHNQAINRGERGIVAWFEAAVTEDWTFAVSDETLALAELKNRNEWATHPKRRPLKNGHLSQSMRFYRNAEIETWADAVLAGDVALAKRSAAVLDENESSIWLTRRLESARAWARRLAVGEQRAGLIASGQARRLAAEGLFVQLKPDIEAWMLAPNSDIRSSTRLETVQNQFQVQGLELDYCVVCWDADLRRGKADWTSHKISGADWNGDSFTDVAKNTYRVLLTRARRGMAIFVPSGDRSGVDVTRNAAFYDGIAGFLFECGAKELPADGRAGTDIV